MQVLAMFVALDMAVGVVALSARRDGRDRVRTTLVAGSVGIPINDRTGTGVLAGANLKKRRGLKNVAGSSRSVEAAPITGTSATSTSTGPRPTSPGATATSTTGPKMDVRATPGSSPQGTTATTRAPASALTTGPGATSSTTVTTRPSATATTGPARATPTTAQPPATGGPRHEVTLTDPVGDTNVDGTKKAIQEPRADIVRAGAAFRSGFLALAMQVQQPVDPRTDERWAGDATFALFSVDTTGDGTPDFDIQYSVSEGDLGGVVTKPASTDVLCEIEGAYGPEGYSAIVDPACLGNPASITFRVALYYDTNPKDDNADVASDVAPNGGMSFPITKP
jgi:hypothetical protein